MRAPKGTHDTMTEKTTKKTTKAAKAKVAKTRSTSAGTPRPADVVFRALGKRPLSVADLAVKTGLTDSKVRDAIRSLGARVAREPLKTAQTAPSGKGRKVRDGYVKAPANAISDAAEPTVATA